MPTANACHCSQCRKQSGHFWASIDIPQTALTFTRDDGLRWFQSSERVRRGFCGTCGSNLFWDGPGSHLSIFAGTIDGESGLTLAGHIYCADKGDYYQIADGLPQAGGDDPALTTQVPG